MTTLLLSSTLLEQETPKTPITGKILLTTLETLSMKYATNQVTTIHTSQNN